MDRFYRLSSTIPRPTSFSKSNILGKDTANGSSLTKANYPEKLCGLISPVPPLVGPAGGACPVYGEFSFSRPGESGGALSLWFGAINVITWPTCYHWMVSTTSCWVLSTLFLYRTACKVGPYGVGVKPTRLYPPGINGLSLEIRICKSLEGRAARACILYAPPT